MALFGFGKKEEEKAPACGCSCSCGTPVEKKAGSTSPVMVLGTGCASCHALLENTKEAAAKIGFDGEVEYVTDLARIAGYGVMRMPALMVNGEVVSSGKVLKPDEIADLLRKAQG